MADYEKALSLISGGSGGGFTPAELVVDGSKFIVKTTPETIDSVFVAVGDGFVIYRTRSVTHEGSYYAIFMGNIGSASVSGQEFEYDETAGGYVYEGGLG